MKAKRPSHVQAPLYVPKIRSSLTTKIFSDLAGCTALALASLLEAAG